MRYIQFPHLARLPGLWHGVFTRRLRCERDGWSSAFNVGLNAGDPERAVVKNRRRMMTAAGNPRAVYARQVHGTEVAVWDNGSDVGENHLDGDALVTNVPGAALVIQTADCQSVMMADPVRRVIANVHSGWRGSVADIIGRTVGKMRSRFGCRPADIVAGIGPSLGPCCAEFKNYQSEIPPHYWPYRRSGDLFDFWRISIDQLADAGVPREQVMVSGICTRCNTSAFFSYRGEGAQAGRFAAVIRW
jgi:YfiH family protein